MIEVDSFTALIGAAQANVIEFHTWNATTRDPRHPDRIVFDLDPGEGVAWRTMQEGAELTRSLLEQIGLASFLKTSGGKGLHVVVPITPKDDWDSVKALAKRIVEHMAETIPERFVAKSGPKNRIGKIFVDYLRNGFGATTACAWSARARPGLGVSVTCEWDELGAITGGDHWTIRNVHERIEERGDAWRDYAKDAADRRQGDEGDRRRARAGLTGARIRSRRRCRSPAGRIGAPSHASRRSRSRGVAAAPGTVTIGAMSDPLHLVDTTMFWSPTGGGVRRYLQTKHDWLAGQPRWRHSIAVPRVAGSEPGAATLPSIALPGSGGYRLPLRRAAIARVLAGLAPDLIEAGDPYRVAWGARDAAQRLGIPAVAYCHSNIAAMARLAAGRRLGAAAARLASAMRATSTAASTSSWRRAAAWPRTSATGASRGSPASRSASTPRSFARRRATWPGGSVTAGRPRPACSSTPAGSRPRNTSTSSPTRSAASARPTCCSPSAPGRHAAPATERVVVQPFVASASELATVLASADAFVHAGDQETFGLSVLEAMACGTPAVVRDAEGLGELAGVGAAIAVPAGTGAAFAAAIDSLFAGDRGARSRAARRQAEASDWGRVLPGLLGHYLRLLGDGRTTPAARDGAAEALQR